MQTRPTIPAGYPSYATYSHEYVTALAHFCEERGYTVRNKVWLGCLSRLQNPAHICKYICKKADDQLSGLRGKGNINAQLRAADDSHWALIIYLDDITDDTKAAAKMLCQSGRCDTFELLEQTPYGQGTKAVLLTGNTKQQMWPKATKTIMRQRIEALNWADIRSLCDWDYDTTPQPQDFKSKLFALTYHFAVSEWNKPFTNKPDEDVSYYKLRADHLLVGLMQYWYLLEGVNYDSRRNPQVTR
jgi:hypothetical protein